MNVCGMKVEDIQIKSLDGQFWIVSDVVLNDGEDKISFWYNLRVVDKDNVCEIVNTHNPDHRWDNAKCQWIVESHFDIITNNISRRSTQQ